MNDQDKTPEVSNQPETEKNQDNLGAEAETADPKVSRRRVLLASLAAAPVVLTLMNRSAFATTTECTNSAGMTLIASYKKALQGGSSAIASFERQHKCTFPA